MEEQYLGSESIEHEPTPEEIIMACSDVLDSEDREFVKDFDVGELLIYVAGKLDKLGKDPEEELTRRGLLEQWDGRDF